MHAKQKQVGFVLPGLLRCDIKYLCTFRFPITRVQGHFGPTVRPTLLFLICRYYPLVFLAGAVVCILPDPGATHLRSAENIKVQNMGMSIQMAVLNNILNPVPASRINNCGL